MLFFLFNDKIISSSPEKGTSKMLDHSDESRPSTKDVTKSKLWGEEEENNSWKYWTKVVWISSACVTQTP